MRFYEIISEALKPSQYREYRKAWNSTTYKELFHRFNTSPYMLDKKAYRIYIPLNNSHSNVQAPLEIVQHLTSKGYEVIDYVGGLASNGTRNMKIGKLLSDSPKVSKLFMNDKRRAASKKDQYYVIISRHPYDIAGMSTDRGWTSCMNLVDGEKREYVINDVKEGTLVAYLISSDDKNINRPLARVTIKPFIQYINNKAKDFILVKNDKVYGTSNSEFEATVNKWLHVVNGNKADGLYCLNDNLYADDEKDKSGVEFKKDDKEHKYDLGSSNIGEREADARLDAILEKVSSMPRASITRTDDQHSIDSMLSAFTYPNLLNIAVEKNVISEADKQYALDDISAFRAKYPNIRWVVVNPGYSPLNYGQYLHQSQLSQVYDEYGTNSESDDYDDYSDDYNDDDIDLESNDYPGGSHGIVIAELF